MKRAWAVIPFALLSLGCGEPRAAIGDAGDAGDDDAGTLTDAGGSDAGSDDAGMSDAGGDDAGDSGLPPDMSDAGYAVQHLAFPQVPTHGGPILASPHLVTITFLGYEFAADAIAFGDWVVGSDWLTTVGADYGVGLGSHLAHVTLGDLAPPQLTDSQIQVIIGSLIDNGTVPAPESDPELVYLLYVPEDVEVSTSGGTGCVSFAGYHYEAHLAAHVFTYGVVLTCPVHGGEPTIEQAMEIVASHELIEAATDPLPISHPAYILTDANNAWSYSPGEVGDSCVIDHLAESNLMVQRIWSNSAAAAGGDPCVPVPAGVYFNASPPSNQPVVLYPGGSAVLDVTGWSSGPMAPWVVVAVPRGGNFQLGAMLSRSTLSNGQVAQLTLSAPTNAPQGGLAALELLSLSATQQALWPIVVVVQ